MPPTAPTMRRKTAPQPSRASRSGSGFNTALLITTIFAGAAAWLAGNLLFGELKGKFYMPLLMGLVFFILFFILIACVLICRRISGGTGGAPTGLSGHIGTLPSLILLAAVVTGGAVLFQWIYGLESEKIALEPTSYVFVIDDSGSMEDSDPAQLRYAAIAEVLSGVDGSFPYMVYSFADGVQVVRDMKPVSEGMDGLSGTSNGGTAILGALTQVMGDYESGAWNGGAVPRVILLTDGYATDISRYGPLNSLLKKYQKANISIGAVGLGKADDSLMRAIADSTGGAYVDVSDASELGAAFSLAASEQGDRILLASRPPAEPDVLYGIMRVVFLTLLGAGLGLAAAEAYGHRESYALIVVTSLVKSLLGALIMELGTGMLFMPDLIAWLLLWLFISATLATKPASYKRGPSRPVKSRSSMELSHY